MRKWFAYDEKNPGGLIFSTMVLFSLVLILFGVICGPPEQLLPGIWRIITERAVLITDSMMVGGMGAAFVNAGLVSLLSLVILRACKATVSGITIAAVLLMAGFSLFGKDVWNILPILLGGWLYAKFKREPFSRYVYITLFGTALAPVVTELAVTGGDLYLLRLLIPLAVGILVGFILPAISVFTVRVHQGYNLYNVGFAAGLVGMVLASVFKSFGYVFGTRLEWSTGKNLQLSVFLFILFGAMFLAGFLYNGKSLKNLVRITRHSGRSVADFVHHDGYPVVLMNMGLIGALATVYVLAAGGELNGPTVGGVLTVCGFGGFGKHVRNIVPVMLGVVISSFLMVWQLSDPAVLLAALFATGLAPIAGQFGWKWGVLAGAVHASVVLNVSFLHGGLNLYNNGFSAGLVCIVLVPLIEALRRDS